jgi:AcrR family transcriptional regulator
VRQREAAAGSDRAQRRQRSLADRKHEIVTAAASVFDRDGYGSTSMDDIARTVGIAKPTLYHYFSSKDEILTSIHEEFIDLLLDRHDRRVSSAVPVQEMLLESMVDILELMETHRGHVRVFFENHRELPAQSRDSIRRKRDRYENAVADAIAANVAAGSFRAVDAHLAALAVFGMCNWAYQWYRPSGPYRPREIAVQFWDMLLRGLDCCHAAGDTTAVVSSSM